jgi:hypothetical protein
VIERAIERTDTWFEERLKLGKYNQAGVISLCPVCDNGVNASCDDKAKFIDSNWFHGPCSRFALLAAASTTHLVEKCPICGTADLMLQGDVQMGRGWWACAHCALPVARWDSFPIQTVQPSSLAI